jgi:hypothetical protein
MNAVELQLEIKLTAKRKRAFSRSLQFEFWPTWLIYLPIIPYGIWLALKSKSLTFFSAANPFMYLGGLIGESKSAILEAIPNYYLPNTIYLNKHENVEAVLGKMAKAAIQFPVVIKPDVGERGKGVAKIKDVVALENYLAQQQTKLIVQAFSTYPIELGVLYYRFPNGKQSGITSIVSKSFLTVTGDGESTLQTLIQHEKRAQPRLEYLFNEFKNRLGEVLPAYETLLLEPIGNHCRGTAFNNANHLITPKLVTVFDNIAKQINGFYIGRFDLKVNSLDELKEGKGIHILELNGVTSEPAHIYDPNEGLISNYKALFQHWQLVYQIAKQNKQRGVQFATLQSVLLELYQSKNAN